MIRRLTPLILFAVLVPGALFWILSRDAHAAVAPAGNEAIAKAMHEMNDALEVLGKGITAANKDAALEQLTKFETAVITAKAAVPASAAKVEEKKRPAFLADYRKTLLEGLDFRAKNVTAALQDATDRGFELGLKCPILEARFCQRKKRRGLGLWVRHEPTLPPRLYPDPVPCVRQLEALPRGFTAGSARREGHRWFRATRATGARLPSRKLGATQCRERCADVSSALQLA